MNTIDILNSEKRTSNNLYDIHLYKEGCFWNAYEWSAFLCRNFPSELSEDERLKPIKKKTKQIDDGLIQIGLQDRSFNKYFPNIIDDITITEIKDDNHIIIHTNTIINDYSLFKYEELLLEWKNTVPFNIATNKRKHKNELITNEPIIKDKKDELMNVIYSIKTFPIEHKTIVECFNFLSEIKIKLTSLD